MRHRLRNIVRGQIDKNLRQGDPLGRRRLDRDHALDPTLQKLAEMATISHTTTGHEDEQVAFLAQEALEPGDFQCQLSPAPPCGSAWFSESERPGWGGSSDVAPRAKRALWSAVECLGQRRCCSALRKLSTVPDRH